MLSNEYKCVIVVLAETHIFIQGEMDVKKTKVILAAMIAAVSLTGCCISHEWQEATCETPQTCVKCGKIEGEALGHTWKAATCTEPKTCSVCGKTEGEAIGHFPREWEVIKQPSKGKPGLKVQNCRVCGEKIQEKEIEYKYSHFKMGYTQYISQLSEVYGQDTKIIQKPEGDILSVGGKETAIVFHKDLNKKSDGASAYGSSTDEKFNQITLRIIDQHSSEISIPVMAYMEMIGGIATAPLVGESDCSELAHKISAAVKAVMNTDVRTELAGTVGNYRYTVTAYVVKDAYSRVFYEFTCEAL